jgi:hypothetical protein
VIELTWLAELIKLIGFPAVIFAIWYVSHLANQKTVETLQQANEETIQSLQHQYDKIIALQKDYSDRNFDLLKDISRTNELQCGLLGELKTMISLNQFCPVVRQSAGANR